MDLLNKAISVLSTYGEVQTWKDIDLNIKVKCDALNPLCHFIVTPTEIFFYHKTMLLREFTCEYSGTLKIAFDCPAKELKWWMEDIKRNKCHVLSDTHSNEVAIIVEQKDIMRFESEEVMCAFMSYETLSSN
ncbi:hypothetical protein [Bdellovibrio bacteriovorus]|uniref:hypothetical protein n=1 Tax=Bdellovibrio bacteriovorus TaxID=959 RepID=UPI0035A66BC7